MSVGLCLLGAIAAAVGLVFYADTLQRSTEFSLDGGLMRVVGATVLMIAGGLSFVGGIIVAG